MLEELGALHYGRKKIQPIRSDLRAFMHDATEKLEHPVIEFDRADTDLLAQSIAEVIERETYTCYAWVIMPDHVHGLIRKHKHTAEEMIANFQIECRLRLRECPRRSFDHPVWGGHGWKVFLEHPDEIRRTIKYIEDNPLKLHRPIQKYNFVKPYDNWPFHKGFNPNSPYVKRLKDERS